MNIPIALDRSALNADLAATRRTFMDGAAELPFGGTKQSGLGREFGRNAVADYPEEKTLHFHTGSRTARWLPIRQSGAA